MEKQIYWNTFYLSHTNSTPSNFCKFIIEYFFSNDNIKRVIDCGCGNGRDSYELSKKYYVDGVDNSGFIPESSNPKLQFKKDDFVNLDKSSYDLVYSRFTFHSITNQEHMLFLQTIKIGSFLAIECRSLKGEDDKVFHGKTHFRNYIDLHYLEDLLKKKNFEILFICESRGFAKYNDEDPICIRVICQKQLTVSITNS